MAAQPLSWEDNGGAQVQIHFIGRDDETRTSLANLGARRRVERNKPHLIPPR
jgi:hypothetical protein